MLDERLGDSGHSVARRVSESDLPGVHDYTYTSTSTCALNALCSLVVGQQSGVFGGALLQSARALVAARRPGARRRCQRLYRRWRSGGR